MEVWMDGWMDTGEKRGEGLHSPGTFKRHELDVSVRYSISIPCYIAWNTIYYHVSGSSLPG